MQHTILRLKNKYSIKQRDKEKIANILVDYYQQLLGEGRARNTACSVVLQNGYVLAIEN